MLELRPYQKEDVQKLKPLNCVAILNQQRTGKTPTSLILCREKQCKKILIICPGSLLYKWQKEFEQWLQLPCIVLDGTPAIRKKKLEKWTKNTGLCITYGTLKLINRKDTSGNIIKSGELMNIIQQHPDTVIVDEFHRARNPKTALAKALFKLSTVIPYRIALTGTPAYGKSIDVYSLIKFLYPNNIGTFNQFIIKHCNLKTIYTPKGPINIPDSIKKESEIKIQNFLNKIAVQRKQSDPDVMPWLPDKPIPELLYLNLNKEQETMLNNLKNYFETDNIITQNSLDRIIRYRQILNDPRILEPTKNKSPKTEWILQYATDYPETPTIFFSNFTEYIKLLQTELQNKNIKSEVIIGATPKKKREELITEFQNKKINFLFINIQAGQEGLTLDVAENLIFIDQYPPTGAIEQAIERITATTEDKAKIPKQIFKLIMKNTLEETIEESIKLGLTETEAFNNFKKYIEK